MQTSGCPGWLMCTVALGVSVYPPRLVTKAPPADGCVACACMVRLGPTVPPCPGLFPAAEVALFLVLCTISDRLLSRLQHPQDGKGTLSPTTA